jgi:DNA-binding transcriptional LysR family regulator
MDGFEFDQLRTLAAVADAGSLTAAAPRLFLSQSAVSEQIRKLEDKAGQRLLVRAKRGVTLTPAGDRLLAHARRLLALNEEAYRDLRGVPLLGELRLAVTDYFRPGDIAPLLRRLGQNHPGVRLHVAILKSGVIEQAYARGEFDVAISMRIESRGAGGRRPPAGLRLRREPLCWTAAEGAPPAFSRTAPLPLVALPDTCALHQYTVGLLDRAKVPYLLAHVASGVAGMQQAVAAGLGIACLNASSLGPGMARLAPGRRLPALPDATFHLLPPRQGESAFVAQAREALGAQFSQPVYNKTLSFPLAAP